MKGKAVWGKRGGKGLGEGGGPVGGEKEVSS